MEKEQENPESEDREITALRDIVKAMDYAPPETHQRIVDYLKLRFLTVYKKPEAL